MNNFVLSIIGDITVLLVFVILCVVEIYLTIKKSLKIALVIPVLSFLIALLPIVSIIYILIIGHHLILTYYSYTVFAFVIIILTFSLSRLTRQFINKKIK